VCVWQRRIIKYSVFDFVSSVQDILLYLLLFHDDGTNVLSKCGDMTLLSIYHCANNGANDFSPKYTSSIGEIFSRRGIGVPLGEYGS
jgi:hypothetical protein